MTATLSPLGRPSLHSEYLIAVGVDGRGAAWCDGVFSGDPDIVNAAHQAAESETVVPVGRGTMTAGFTTLFGVVAALHAFDPERTVLTAAPPRILEAVEDLHGAHEPPGHTRV